MILQERSFGSIIMVPPGTTPIKTTLLATICLLRRVDDINQWGPENAPQHFGAAKLLNPTQKTSRTKAWRFEVWRMDIFFERKKRVFNAEIFMGKHEEVTSLQGSFSTTLLGDELKFRETH